MAHRKFTDSFGIEWDVWEVEPSRAERRTGGERRTGARGPDRRRASDGPRVRISSELAHGWLCFQSRIEKRRLVPVPEGWEQLPDEDLRRLLEKAGLAGRPRRLID